MMSAIDFKITRRFESVGRRWGQSEEMDGNKKEYNTGHEFVLLKGIRGTWGFIIFTFLLCIFL